MAVVGVPALLVRDAQAQWVGVTTVYPNGTLYTISGSTGCQTSMPYDPAQNLNNAYCDEGSNIARAISYTLVGPDLQMNEHWAEVWASIAPAQSGTFVVTMNGGYAGHIMAAGVAEASIDWYFEVRNLDTNTLVGQTLIKELFTWVLSDQSVSSGFSATMSVGLTAGYHYGVEARVVADESVQGAFAAFADAFNIYNGMTQGIWINSIQLFGYTGGGGGGGCRTRCPT